MEKDYKQLANDLRKIVLGMTFRAQSSHIGSNFSCADILTVLYDIADLSLIEGGITKDIIVVKSWAAASVYACLVRKNLLPQEAIDKYGEGKWTTILDAMPPYIAAGIGSMGYHFPFAVGFALAKKIKKEKGIVYCLISDGELDIGSTWESLAIAKQLNLTNLILLIDVNKLQALGNTKDILDMEPIEDKFKSFGWYVQRINGHNFNEIILALNKINPLLPNVLICDTIKGKGWKRAENNNLFHYSHVNEEMLKEAMEELNNEISEGIYSDSKSNNKTISKRA